MNDSKPFAALFTAGWGWGTRSFGAIGEARVFLAGYKQACADINVGTSSLILDIMTGDVHDPDDLEWRNNSELTALVWATYGLALVLPAT